VIATTRRALPPGPGRDVRAYGVVAASQLRGYNCVPWATVHYLMKPASVAFWNPRGALPKGPSSPTFPWNGIAPAWHTCLPPQPGRDLFRPDKRAQLVKPSSAPGIFWPEFSSFGCPVEPICTLLGHGAAIAAILDGSVLAAKTGSCR